MMVRLMLAVLRVLPEEWDIDGTFLYAIETSDFVVARLATGSAEARIPWVSGLEGAGEFKNFRWFDKC
jgi:hypothetical protein